MIARILFCSFVLFLGLLSVHAQVGVNSISGNVFNEARRPVPQLFVELLTEFNSMVQRTQTNQSGHYSFMRVPYGKFIVRVRPYGTDLEEQEKAVDIYNMSGDARRQMPMYEQADFYLARRRSAGTTPEITGVVFAQDVPKEALDIFASVNRDDTSESAVAKLESAVKIFPKYHDALLRLGQIYIKNQNFADAETAFTTVVEVNPKGASGWYGLGYSQFSLNKPGAVEALLKSVEVDKNSVDSWLLLGLAQRKAKAYGEALKALLQAKKLDNGKNADINWNLALLYYHNLKKPREAADELVAFLKINKDAENKEQVKSLIEKFRSEDPYSAAK